MLVLEINQFHDEESKKLNWKEIRSCIFLFLFLIIFVTILGLMINVIIKIISK